MDNLDKNEEKKIIQTSMMKSSEKTPKKKISISPMKTTN
jgi:hypothetical protein